jgi:hypothetical protein
MQERQSHSRALWNEATTGYANAKPGFAAASKHRSPEFVKIGVSDP